MALYQTFYKCELESEVQGLSVIGEVKRLDGPIPAALILQLHLRFCL